jgi:hypothetical protein
MLRSAPCVGARSRPVIWGMPTVNYDLMFQAWSAGPMERSTRSPTGIVKGKPFSPNSRMQAALIDGAREAHAWLVARYEASLSSAYYQGGHWARPGSRELFEGQAAFFAKPDVYPVDVRGVTFSYAYFTPKHVGTGSSYLLTIADKDGRLLDGDANYRLTVPANAQVGQ